MSKISIDKLRKIQLFLPWNEWPTELKYCTNCISYALGLPLEDSNKEFFSKIISGENPVEKLEKLLSDLQIYSRKIDSLDELEAGEMAILMYHYYYSEYEYDYEHMLQFTGRTLQEIHLVRVETDGTWTHKFGWEVNPSITNAKAIHDSILREDRVDLDGPTAIYAIRKP